MDKLQDKVKLPKQVVEAIAEFNRCEENNRDILIAILGNANSKAATTIREFAKLDVNFEILLEALVNGYGVENTPEEDVRDMFNAITPEGWKFTGDANDPVYIERCAIRRTCNLLGITVEGVNDHESN